MTSELFTLVTKKAPEPHFFDAAKSVLLADGNENVERECVKCGLVRITFIPRKGQGGRFYRWGDAGQFTEASDPECPGALADIVKREAV
jgi:hypothetical protein